MTRLLFAVRGTMYSVLLVIVLYTPTMFLIPDELWWNRYLVWCLGWTGAYVMQWFNRWYDSTW